MRTGYRVGQFWNALHARPQSGQLEQVRQILNPALMSLFLSMQPSEQAHSLNIYQQLIAQDENNPDLLIAALLHDVGKIRYPLHILERVLIVIGKSLFPAQVHKWGQALPAGWKRPFIVSEQHAAWGAEMAAKAGASDLTVELIRRHQDKTQPHSFPENSPFPGEVLLFRLQTLDDES